MSWRMKLARQNAADEHVSKRSSEGTHLRPLMRQRGLLYSDVPGTRDDVLRYVGIDVSAFLVDGGGRRTRLSHLLQLFRLPPVLPRLLLRRLVILEVLRGQRRRRLLLRVGGQGRRWNAAVIRRHLCVFTGVLPVSPAGCREGIKPHPR